MCVSFASARSGDCIRDPEKRPSVCVGRPINYHSPFMSLCCSAPSTTPDGLRTCLWCATVAGRRRRKQPFIPYPYNYAEKDTMWQSTGSSGGPPIEHKVLFGWYPRFCLAPDTKIITRMRQPTHHIARPQTLTFERISKRVKISRGEGGQGDRVVIIVRIKTHDGEEEVVWGPVWGVALSKVFPFVRTLSVKWLAIIIIVSRIAFNSIDDKGGSACEQNRLLVWCVCVCVCVRC